MEKHSIEVMSLFKHMSDSSLTVKASAPDFTLPSIGGEQITLSEVLKSGNALLVFLRHLG